MDNSIKITVIVVCAVIVLASLGGFLYYKLQRPSQEKTISVQGNSVLKVQPDLVAVYINVETLNSSSDIAGTENARIVEDLKVKLIMAGFEKKDIETQNYDVAPDYDWSNGNQRLRGYKAVHSLKVSVSSDKTDMIGKAVDAATSTNSLVLGISFELSQDKNNEYKAQALKAAGQDARTKAEAMAAGLGLKLGEVQSVSSQDYIYSPWRMYDAVAGAVPMAANSEASKVATDIQPGQREVSANIAVIYTLK